ncbi:MAG: transporter substrate-binding domain-containing protein [Pseudomonadota bacterium]
MTKCLFICFGLALMLINLSTQSANLILGVEKLDYLPFYTSKNGQYHGYARELFDQFAKDNHHHISYKILPVARLFHELINGKIDLKFPDNPNWKKKEKQQYKINYSSAIVQFTDGIMVKPEFLHKNVNYFYQIGTMRGFTPWTLQNSINQKTIRITEHNSLSGLLQQVILQRVKGCYINIDVAEYFLDKHLNQPGVLVFKSDLPHDKSSYYLSSIKKTDILKQFNSWLDNNTAFHQQLKKKWGL